MIDTVIILLSFIIGTILAGKIRWYCHDKGMINQVNHRSSHKNPTVRGGGLAFVLISLVGMVAALPIIKPEPLGFFVALIIGGAAVANIGWLDDIKSRPAWMRFLTQAIAVGMALFFMPQMFGNIAPLWAEKLFLFFAWMWFVNLYNFLDGIDGYASMQAVFLSICISVINPQAKMQCLAIAGSVLGFLRINWHPAKAFMGDVGSTFLGYILGGLLIHTLSLNPKGLFFPLITISLLFVADATYTLFKRALQRKKPWQAHREHWYQRAVQAGMPHDQVVRNGIFLNIVFMILTVLGYYGGYSLGAFIIALVVFAAACKRIQYFEGK